MWRGRNEPIPPLRLAERFDQRVFDAIYSRSLVYNACWEDPAVDRLALELAPADRLLVITSAGCNVLDYAITAPARIHAVDANPRQNALLELKLAGIRRLDFGDFFALFGHGRHADFRALYHELLRDELSTFARAYWDRKLEWFREAEPDSFYYHGLSGLVARAFRGYLRVRPQLRAGVEALLEASTLDQQREIYDAHVAPFLWTRPLAWTLERQLTMTMLGVPHAQRKEVERQHAGGVAAFVREALEYVLRQVPVWTNYFWTLYLRGCYTLTNCPEYLRSENFLALKNGLVDRIVIHTCTVTEFLQSTSERISKFVLLDHMDWMSSYHPDALAAEWRAIFARASDEARLIFRSAHETPGYLARVLVGDGAAQRPITEALDFHPELARELTLMDRVHTYAGFHIADLRR